ncbi:MAG: glycoside hydrolase family 27 protein [Acidobacteria bacterium]|nr:glycoside hydrolase family 27 protein [Acidobacteriota bacterium]
MTGQIRRIRALCIFAFLFAVPHLRAEEPAFDGLAKTPPMGWNSWNKFACDVSEELIRETADAMVSSGMKDAGYEYVVIDDCWQVARDENGNIAPDPERFPSGMKALADYVHSKGLKFGLYSDAGTKTCQGRPGSRGFEEKDARQYAAWGVDYLKYDWCNTEGMDTREAYTRMSRALRDAGRPIVFSICEWGSTQPWLWAPGVGHLWRTTGDIQDCWECSQSWGGMGMLHIIDLQENLYPYGGPGHWNDPDMLEVGNGKMTAAEYRSHFSFWCLLAAPLMAGNDLRDMTPETKDILTNREVIAVDQDPLGIQGRKIHDGGAVEVWMKPLSGAARAVILFNRGSVKAPVSVSWEQIGLAPEMEAEVRDLWAREDLGVFKGRFVSRVDPHGVVMIRVQP